MVKVSGDSSGKGGRYGKVGALCAANKNGIIGVSSLNGWILGAIIPVLE